MRLTNMLVLAAVAGAPWSARADVCPPTAVIGGPSDGAQPLTKALVARGVQIEPAGLPAGPCPSLHVEVTREADQFRVQITDPWGRRVDRTLADVRTAATLIEAWARMDLIASTDTSTAVEPSAAAVAPNATALAAAPLAASPPTEAAPPVEAKEAARAPAPPLEASREGSAGLESSAVLVAVRGELGLARDRKMWGGSAVTACVRLGSTCVGILGRYAAADRGGHRVDALGLLALPLTLDRFSITPGLGVGVGFQGAEDRRFFGPGGSFDAPRNRGGGSDDDPQLRVEARVDVGYRFGGSFSALAGVSASAAPDFGGKLLGDTGDQILRVQLGLMWGIP